MPKQRLAQSRDLGWGMGYVTERASGRWQSRWFDGEKYKAKTFPSREEAEDWLRDLSRARGWQRPERPSFDAAFVYFIQSVEGGPIKIGQAANPADRLKNLQLGCPVQLRILGIVEGGLMMEKSLHRQFAQYRMHGEWFDAHPKLLQWIEKTAHIVP